MPRRGDAVGRWLGTGPEPGKEGEAIPPVTVPGTVLEIDARGITWVVFPGITLKPTLPPPSPGMIILEAGGDGDPGWHVLPVWGNGNDPNDFLRLNSWSAAMCYSSSEHLTSGERKSGGSP